MTCLNFRPVAMLGACRARALGFFSRKGVRLRFPVVSPASYNSKTGLMVCCPLTTKIKGHPFEVMTEVDGIPSAVLADQVKSLDWTVRNAKRKGTVAADVMVHVRAKIKALLLIP
jgi:mRNA interferase MazF